MFQTAFVEKNPNTKLINPAASTELLNKKSLVEPYSKLLTVYWETGIPNTVTLMDMGKQLNVDAIIQGFVVQMYQRDGDFWGAKTARTTIVIKYIMFSTNLGKVLWETSCDGDEEVSSLKKAPPVSEVLEIIREKMISAIPILTRQ